MINALEGIPGGGKSYEAVAFHILPALEQGRKVITNLPLNIEALAAINASWPSLIERRTAPARVLGTWDAERPQAFMVEGEPQPPKPGARTFGGVWDFYDQWRHPDTGQGALFVVDECHVAMPRVGTPAEVVQWFKLHRHFNADVLLLTQNFRDLNGEISGLIHFLHKVRQADLLGKPGYIKKVHAGYRGGLVSTQERPYDPKYFALYRSHTQGNAVAATMASDVKSSLVGWRRMSRVFYAVTAVVCVWAFWPSDKPAAGSGDAGAPSKSQRVVQAAAAVPGPAKPAAPAVEPSAAPAIGEAVHAVDVQPLLGKRVHVTGAISMGRRTIYTFSLSQGGQRFADVTSDDLRAAGYVYEHLAPCMGRLRYGDLAYPVSCDAPHLSSGTERAPVVVDLPGKGVGAAQSAQVQAQPEIAPWNGGRL